MMDFFYNGDIIVKATPNTMMKQKNCFFIVPTTPPQGNHEHMLTVHSDTESQGKGHRRGHRKGHRLTQTDTDDMERAGDAELVKWVGTLFMLQPYFTYSIVIVHQ